MDSVENISPVFRGAVMQLGGPENICIYSDVHGTLITAADQLRQSLYRSLLWATKNRAELRMISASYTKAIEELVHLGADMQMLGPINDKAGNPFADMPNKPLLYMEDYADQREMFLIAATRRGLPAIALDPESL